MIAFTASWMTISSNVMPPNALTDGTVIIAYIENGVVRGAAGAPSARSVPDSLPEIAFSVEACVRRQGVGSVLFRKLIAEARSEGYHSLRITTGAQNQAMRALANKFGAHSDIPPRRVHRKHRSEAASAARTCKICDRNAGRSRTRDRWVQSRVLEAVSANVWLGPDGLTGGACIRQFTDLGSNEMPGQRRAPKARESVIRKSGYRFKYPCLAGTGRSTRCPVTQNFLSTFTTVSMPATWKPCWRLCT